MCTLVRDGQNATLYAMHRLLPCGRVGLRVDYLCDPHALRVQAAHRLDESGTAIIVRKGIGGLA